MSSANDNPLTAAAPAMLALLRRVADIVPDHDWDHCGVNGYFGCDCDQGALLRDVYTLLEPLKGL